MHQLSVLCLLPASHVRDLMEASAQRVSDSPRDRLLGMAVSPYVIVSAIVAGTACVAVLGARDLSLWLFLVAGAAGWSSAWSP